MVEIAAAVQQQTPTYISDGQSGSLSGNRRRALHVADQYDQWLRAGQIFEAHFATEGGTATIEANATLDLTEPFFRLTVPSSKILVPIQVKIAPTVVWVTADAVVMYTADTNTYNTGGAAPDVRNLAHISSTDSAINSATSSMESIYDGDSVLTENALTNPRILDVANFRTGGLFPPYEYNILKGDPMVMIHGASSWAIAVQANGALECFYTVKWAELDKSELVNA